jgi:hypothetical protein
MVSQGLEDDFPPTANAPLTGARRDPAHSYRDAVDNSSPATDRPPELDHDTSPTFTLALLGLLLERLTIQATESARAQRQAVTSLERRFDDYFHESSGNATASLPATHATPAATSLNVIAFNLLT